jgi:hypothetical protein
VLLQVEMDSVGVERRLDRLPPWLEKLFTQAGLFALADKSKEVGTGCGEVAS